MAYLACHGARTPLLAFMAFRKPRNVILAAVPFVLVATLGLLLGATIVGPLAAGAVALALAPAPLLVPAIATRLGVRGDNGGALVSGSLALSVVAYALAASPRLASAEATVVQGVWAFGFGLIFASAVPQLRDLVLGPLARLRDLATLVLVVVAIVQVGPALQPFAFVIAAMLLGLGVGVAALLARVAGREMLVTIGASGLKDPFFAVVVALVAVGPAAAAVPLAYGLLLVLMAALVGVSRQIAKGSREL